MMHLMLGRRRSHRGDSSRSPLDPPLRIFFLCTALGLGGHALGHAVAPLDHPLGKREIDWRPHPAIERVLWLNFDFHAGDHLISWSPPARVEQREGRDCIVGGHVLFDVDEAFIFDADETVTLELTFDATATDGFVVSYDHAIAPVAREFRLPESKVGGRWRTETVRLERARFANRKYEGTDFSIAGLGSRLQRQEGARGEFVLCGLAIRRSHEPAGTPPERGTLVLTVTDEHGRPTPARAGIYAPDGRAPLAAASALAVERYAGAVRDLPLFRAPRAWSQQGRYVFFTDGAYEAQIAPGSYKLFLMKGPEYRVRKVSFSIDAGKTTTVKASLERWIDMPAEGWHSGDDHIHLSRATAAQNATIHTYMRAEDIHVANLLEMGNLAGSAFRQYAFGEEGRYVRGGYALVPGQESPRTSHRGHSIGLNGKAFHWFGEDYFLYDRVADAIHADGGLWGYAHISTDAFNVRYGLALDVPRGKVDFIEILQFGLMDTTYLYDFLNLGFRLLPSAGSDYPYLHLPGTERIYVRSGAKGLPQAWFERLRSGRSFVSNAPMIGIAVGGDRERSEYEVQAGQPLVIEAHAAINPDFDRLDRLELVAHGEVLETVRAKPGDDRVTLRHAYTPERSAWLAVRAYGQQGALAHSAPIYLYVDGDRNFAAPPEKARQIARKYQQVLAEFRRSEPDLEEEWERASVEGLVEPRWRAAKPRLDALIEEALAIYERIGSAR